MKPLLTSLQLFSNNVSNMKHHAAISLLQVAGIKHMHPPKIKEDIEWPENRKLPHLDKVPTYPSGLKPPKMQKRLIFMRGPEEVHNFLIYKQFGIQAVTGGRLKHEHLEMIRNAVNPKIDPERMFVIWRIDPPWQSCVKRSAGHRMGGGKGNIHHYVTPLKAGRIIIELGGLIDEVEARYVIGHLEKVLPFRSEFVSQESMEKKKELMELRKKYNANPYTFEYVIKNNLGGCNKWLGKYDYIWFGEYR